MMSVCVCVCVCVRIRVVYIIMYISTTYMMYRTVEILQIPMANHASHATVQ